MHHLADGCARVLSCLGKQEVVRALAGAGARLDYGVGTEQGTALHAAVLAGHDGVVRELLELGANPNIKASGCTHGSDWGRGTEA